MELTQPLKPKFVLENKCYNIEYESLHSFCFLCGRTDHRKEACRFKLPSSPPDDIQIAVTGTKNSNTPVNVINGNLQSTDTTEETFGPWMLVTKRGRRPIQSRKAQESTGPTSKPNKFKYLDEGQDGQRDHFRGRKTNRTGNEKAQLGPSLQMGSSQTKEVKGKEKVNQIQSQSLKQSNQTQPSPLNHLSSASSFTAIADSSTKASVCAQLNGDVYGNVEQQLPTVTDMSCALEPITSKEDSTMVDATVTHTLTINSNLAPFSSTCFLDQLTKKSEPPDPDPVKINNGERWRADTRSSGESNREAPQPEQSSGAVIRTRERSSLPSHFRLVDRATTVDNRTKLGDNPTHPFHSIQMASLRSMEDDHWRIRSIIKELAVKDLPPYPSIDLLRLLFWNCREADSNKFKRNIVEIIKTHKPEILVLMETKVTYSQMSNFFNRLGFTTSSVVDPVGRVDGIWIIWDTSQVNVITSTVNSQLIHATVHKEEFEEWVLAIVYVSPNPTLRAHLWKELEDMVVDMEKP
ncbi:unnamed protein product [Camellia sinensis]